MEVAENDNFDRVFTNDKFVTDVFKEFQDMRKTGELIDCKLKVQG